MTSTIRRFWLYLRGITNSFGSRFGKRLSPIAAMVLFGLAISLSVWGDTSTVTISNASVTVTSNSSTTLSFPISRGADTSYDAFVQYQTQDGTAIAGTDYTAASGSIVIPAGTTSATIPVTVAGSTSNPADKTFQMLLQGGGGAGMGFAATFGPQQTSTTGSQPGSLLMADFNGDGKPDGAVVNFGDNTVSVFINTPMTVQQTFAVGSAPDSIAAADLNGDGKPDLVVANSGDNTVSVLLNTTAPGATTASFAAQQTFGTGNGPASVTVADVNGDGKPDLVVTNQFGNTVSVLLNTTAPGATTVSFAAQQTFATGNNPAAAAMADVNGDGRPDLIVVNNSDATLSVMLNTTAPGASTVSFATQQTFATGSLPNSVAAADFNGDGKPDVVVAWT